jgi:hypothetical protein
MLVILNYTRQHKVKLSVLGARPRDKDVGSERCVR